MDFEKYWENGCFGEYHDIYAKNLAEQFYKAGQQSKQAEIDALQKRIDEALNVFKSDLSEIGKFDTIHKILKGELK